eukprot:gene13045-14384_t
MSIGGIWNRTKKDILCENTPNLYRCRLFAYFAEKHSTLPGDRRVIAIAESVSVICFEKQTVSYAKTILSRPSAQTTKSISNCSFCAVVPSHRTKQQRNSNNSNNNNEQFTVNNSKRIILLKYGAAFGKEKLSSQTISRNVDSNVTPPASMMNKPTTTTTAAGTTVAGADGGVAFKLFFASNYNDYDNYNDHNNNDKLLFFDDEHRDSTKHTASDFNSNHKKQQFSQFQFESSLHTTRLSLSSVRVKPPPHQPLQQPPLVRGPLPAPKLQPAPGQPSPPLFM